MPITLLDNSNTFLLLIGITMATRRNDHLKTLNGHTIPHKNKVS